MREERVHSDLYIHRQTDRQTDVGVCLSLSVCMHYLLLPCALRKHLMVILMAFPLLVWFKFQIHSFQVIRCVCVCVCVCVVHLIRHEP